MHSASRKICREVWAIVEIAWAIAVLLALIVMLAGCGSQTTLVPPGQVVRLAADTPAKIATYQGRDGSGNPVWAVSPNLVTLPAGYYVAPPPTLTPATTQTGRTGQ